ncbi:MAG: Panacea domain-containing protein, partial [Cyanobacteriota bacterium]
MDYLKAAHYFIIKAYEDGVEADITNMKVQKLLYYAQSLHLALYDEPLFNEVIQAWRYGPVCPPAYRFYHEFEAKQLPIPSLDELKAIPPEQKQVLDETWIYFGWYHAYRLSEMTHGEFPWKKARRGLPPEAAST